ncbi:MAG: hypothetical protein ACI4MA_09340 [Treponema sp.]
MKKTLIYAVLLAIFYSFASADVYTLYDPSYLYTQDDEGNLKWLATIDAGTKFDETKDFIVPEKINGKENSNNLQYVSVDYKGKKAWILKSGLIEDSDKVSLSSIGVITDEAAVYTWGNKAAVEKFTLPVGTVVAVSNGESYGVDGSLAEIYFYDNQVFWKIRKAYVLKSKVSSVESDYDAVILAKTALSKDVQKEKEVIVKLLSLAQERAGSTGIVQFVEEAVQKIEEKEMQYSNEENSAE